ncbi:MAG: penicillin acylase family protein [Deltaproteobacteria bacterium]|nr:penicillin acylase family protein [Deltaproteobacteria bacterium]MCL5878288.1 penicillin acylase family protein [Deltaproteobacteria bacterium]
MKRVYTITFLLLLTVAVIHFPGCSGSSSGSPMPKIVRDSYGIAHIYANNDYSLFYGVGWAEAQDRLVQMEFMRRDAEGTLSEIMGTLALSSDIPMHQLFYSEAEREQAFNNITDTTIRTAILAYCDGVNAYIKHIYSDPTLSKVPYEFYNLGAFVQSLTRKYGLPAGVTYRLLSANNGQNTVFEPGPWTPEDVISITDLLVDFFGTGGGRQLQDLNDVNVLTSWFQGKGFNAATAQQYALQVFNDTRWLDDPLAPTSIPNNTPGGAVITANGNVQTTPAIPGGITVTPKSMVLTAAPLDGHAQQQYNFIFSLPPASVTRAMDDFYKTQKNITDMRKQLGIFYTEGSNAWAVAPTLTATNSALMWGGPQEGFSVPNIDDEMYLHSPDITVGGMKIPGEPIILIGMTKHYGWTTTSGEIDNSEIYVEQLNTAGSGFTINPQTAASNYSVLFNGSYVPMERLVETIHYAGENPSSPAAYLDQNGNPTGTGPILYNVFRVDDSQHFHGPVLSFDLVNGLAFTYRWAYWQTEYSTIEGFAGMDMAQSWSDFDNAVAKVTSLHNFVYADQLGNISFWSAGSEPNFAKGYDDRLPAVGSGGQEWTPWPNGQMYVPYSKWLYTVNPAQGWFVNWNTKPLDVPGVIMEGNNGDEHWGQMYRSDRIAFLLKNNPNKRTVADMENIEKDAGTINGDQNISADAGYLIPYIENAYSALSQQGDPLTSSTFLSQAVQIMQQWNNYLTDTTQIFSSAGYSITPGIAGYSPVIGQPGMMIFAKWGEEIRQILYGNMFCSSSSNCILGETTYNMLLHLLEYPNQNGVPLSFTGTAANYITGTGGQFTQGSYYAFAQLPPAVSADRDHIILYALQQAITQLQNGSPASGGQFPVNFNKADPTTWGYIPVDDIDFDSKDSFASPANSILAGGGISPTNFGKAPSQNRSTYMQVINLTDPAFGENVLAPGENGFIQFNSNGTGTVGSNFGDQIDLFKSFTYKPMNIN